MKTIDQTSWARASQYTYFRGIANPHFAITASVDVTYVMEELKPAGASPFNATLFALVQAANAVPEFRTRFRGDTVVEHEVVHPSVTVPIENDQFAFCDIDYAADWPTFNAACKAAVAEAKQQTALVDRVAHLDDRIHLTCVPWIAFTNLNHPGNGPDDCIPRIAWGRMTRDGKSWQTPVAVQVHHAVIDARHIGQFFTELEQRLTKGAW